MKNTPRRNDEKYLFNPIKYSLSSNTSAISHYNHEQPLQYIKCKRDNNHYKLSGQISSPTTTTSNLNRSENFEQSNRSLWK
jgi:hypothetical protein